MAQTNIESLFQAIAPATDRAPSATRTSGNGPGFDDHLSKASTSIYSPSDYRSPTSKPTPPSQSTSGPPASKPAACPPAPSRQDESNETTTPTSETEVEAESDEHADDDVDESTAAETGAVPTTTSKNAPAKPEAKGRKADHAVRVHAENASVNKKGDAEKAEANATADLANAEAKPESAAIDAALAAAESQQELTSEEAAQVVDKSEQDEPAPTEKQAKDGKRVASNAKGAAEGESATVELPATPIAIPGEGVVATANSAEQATEAKQVAATGAKTTAKAALAENDTDDDSTADETSTGAAQKAEADVSPTKTVAAAIANNVAANVVDASANGERTAKDAGDKAVKSVSAKADPPLGSLDRLNRATSDIASGTRSAENSDAPRVDPARFVGRVAKAFQTANERGGTLQLRLSPPELGALRIQLTVKDGVMSAALETDNAGAKRVLLDNLPALRDRLAEQNIRIEKFDVDVRQEGSGGQANPHGSNQNPQQPQPDRNGPRASRAQQQAIEAAVPAAPAIAPQISSSGINLFV